jgi:hypothetical protein
MRQPLRSAKPMAAVVLSPLRSLAALTALEAGEVDDAGFAAAAGLTQLRQLRLHPRKRKATDVGLLQLTQLTQLTQLSLQKPHFRGVDFYRMVSSGLETAAVCNLRRQGAVQPPSSCSDGTLPYCLFLFSDGTLPYCLFLFAVDACCSGMSRCGGRCCSTA